MMTQSLLSSAPARQPPDAGASETLDQNASMRELVVEYYDFVWRSLRRLGVPSGEVDDALQQVFLVAARRLSSIARGSERAFLFGTVVRVASIARRTASRRRETFDPAQLAGATDQKLKPDEALEYRRARELLDLMLDEMDMELRTIFVLYELEELTVPQIAKLVEVPVGTVASRLRRAREVFQDGLKRYRARQDFRGVK